MALLGLKDGDSVKLRIEGDTLIVKGESSISPAESLNLEMDRVGDLVEGSSSKMFSIVHENVESQLATYVKDEEKNKEIAKWSPGIQNWQKMQSGFQALHEKYKDSINKLENPEFVEATKALEVEYQVTKDYKKYMNSLTNLRNQYAPKLAEFGKEVEQMKKDLEIPYWI